MPPNGGRGSQVPLGNNYIIRIGAVAGGLVVICEEQGGEPSEGYTQIHTHIKTAKSDFLLIIFKRQTLK